VVPAAAPAALTKANSRRAYAMKDFFAAESARARAHLYSNPYLSIIGRCRLGSAQRRILSPDIRYVRMYVYRGGGQSRVTD
jgi:hypothetical protein